MKPDRSTGMFQSLLTGLVALAIAFAALPVRADVLQRTGRVVGDTVTVHLTERR